jgi:deoxyribose-phosphate aldolase
MDKQDLINIIDYTLLKPTATKEDIKNFCEETIKYGFKTVFVNPYYVSYAHNLLHHTTLKSVYRLDSHMAVLLHM